ncbi:MAG: elongation factor Ts, partial [candidate division Zixibacteria bacterium]|nr:elongation factor Ts [candidate division Zixibacteria bacterium]
REIYRTQALNEGKPEKIVDKIVDGKVDKYYAEVCLMEQAYVKDPDKTINDLINETIGKIGENMSIRRFVRFRLGE